jgi:serine/threonine protein kinase
LQGNILIDRNGKALLADFHLSTIKAGFEGTPYYPSTFGALRWRAPELCAAFEQDVAFNLSTACDIYSYGSIMLQVRTMTNLILVFDPHIYYQVLSGRVPYYYSSAVHLIGQVSKRVHPDRPSESPVSDIHWAFIQHCWDLLPSARPCVEEVNDQVAAFGRGLM